MASISASVVASSGSVARSALKAMVAASVGGGPEGGGGGTRFTHLNVTVEAKRGRAVFWPSVHDHDPSAIREHSDPRTTHEALTVTRGQKFAANMWLHQFDFQNSLAAGCRNEDQAEWRPSSPEDADSDPPREEPEPPE